MARAAARRRRPSERLQSPISGRVVEECLGVALVGLALLAAIALATYTATDPVFERGLVANRAGVVGATVAALLFRGLGTGAAVLVGAVAVIGVRVMIGRGLPHPASRLWVGSLLLLLSVATLPPLLPQAVADSVGHVGGGALGELLARNERWLVGTWGALLLNGVLLAIGCLSFTGISTSAALAAVARGMGWLGGVLGALAAGLGRAVLTVGRGARGAVFETVAGVRSGVRAVGVWRERRARRARVAAARAPSALEEIAAPHGAEIAGGRRRVRGGEPAIVDHAAERQSGRVQQEAFDFAERGSSGPYTLPDISIFERPPARARSYDRDSLIMNSRIL